MAAPNRLTALDSAFLHLEDHGPAHMHVGSVMIFGGSAPSTHELIAHVESRLHVVPRYRQRLAHVPLGQGRPVWADDPHFNAHYHIRHTALPRPGDDEVLKQLAGRLFSQRLDRSKPLWEIWMVDRLAGDRFALVAKTHHALVDGVSGMDITTVLFDTSPQTTGVAAPAEPWVARPAPSQARLLAEALLERATVPREMGRGVWASLRTPRRLLGQARDSISAVGAMALPGVRSPAPRSPFNVDIGPHRRYTWVDGDVAQFKLVKNRLGGTLNDVVLTTVALALGGYLRREGHDTSDLVLKAMVPVSVRADAERGALGNRVAAMWAPLPVGIEDPRDAYAEVRRSMEHLKRSGQAVGATVLTGLADFAPPTILSQAARLQARQRFFNVVVTNVPGPQFPLYLLGREMQALYPVVPLASRQALGIAIVSYNGRLGFGLLGDFDALPGIELIAAELQTAMRRLASTAGIYTPRPRSPRRPPRQPAAPPRTATGVLSGDGAAGDAEAPRVTDA